MIEKPILGLLTFGSNPDFGDFGVFCACFACFCACSDPKKQFLTIFCYFLAVFPYIWPLARPNIAKKGWPLLGKALGKVWEGFGKGLAAFGKKLNFQAVIKSAAIKT